MKGQKCMMEKLMMIKYGELTTKKENINLFISTLKKNISKKLENEKINVVYDKSRMFIQCEQTKFEEVKIKLKEVFGIHEFLICYKLETLDLEAISQEIIKLIEKKDFKTFKVETKRSNKTIEKTSLEISSFIGAKILKNTKEKTVDVHYPDLTVYVELRSKESYVYFEKEKGLGGYPVSVAGKGMLMLSGGIDSPVSGYLAMKRGVKIEAVYFESPPHTSIEAKNKVIELTKILSKYNNTIKLHVINFTEIQENIYKNIPHEYLITIMRRMMYRICEILAKNNNAKIIVNGESIGQVASQTLSSMSAINEVVRIPVIRPVACFDKLEIIDVAQEIDTFELAIQPFYHLKIVVRFLSLNIQSFIQNLNYVKNMRHGFLIKI